MNGNQLPLVPSANEILLQYPDLSSIVFGLDFDGTLAPIMDHPDLVRLEAEVHQALIRLAEAGHRILICTGRSVEDVLQHVPDAPGIDVIGNHGLQWHVWEEGRRRERDLTPPGWYEWKAEFQAELEKRISEFGGQNEDKRLSLSIHYRGGAKEYWTEGEGRAWLLERVQSPGQLLEGKFVWNVLPEGASKGEAVEHYFKDYPFQKMYFFGDEPTDETVFAKAPGVPVTGVRVGGGDTIAKYQMPSVTAMHRWILDWAKSPR